MASYYPAIVETNATFPPIKDGQPVTGAIGERLRESILAVEAELGVKPSGTFATVRARLDALEGIIGNLKIIELDQDLGGTLENPLVVGIQGRPVSDSPPIPGEVLVWDGIAWSPAPGPGAVINFAGDLAGDPETQQVIGINTVPVRKAVQGEFNNDRGKYLQAIEAFQGPAGIIYDGSNIWVSNAGSSSVLRIDPTIPKIVKIINLPLTISGGLLASDSTHIFVLSSGYNQVGPSDIGYGHIFIIERATNNIVGKIDTVNSGDIFFSIAVNGNNIFVSTGFSTSSPDNNSRVEKYSKSAALAAYPGTVAPLQTLGPNVGGSYDGNMCFGGGSLFVTSGGYDGGIIYKINPASMTVLDSYTEDTPGVGQALGCTFAFGSLWVNNAHESSTGVHRFDPNNLSGGALAFISISPLGAGQNITSDNSTIWYTSGGDTVYRISTDLGSESVIASVSQSPYFFGQPTFDGTFIWTLSTGGYAGGMDAISTGLGTEAWVKFFGGQLEIIYSGISSSSNRINFSNNGSGIGSFGTLNISSGGSFTSSFPDQVDLNLPPPVNLYFRPSVFSGIDNITQFNDWTTLYNARLNIPLPVVIHIDSITVTPAEIPSGVWDFTNQFQPTEIVGCNLASSLQFDDGAVVTGITAFRSLGIQTANTFTSAATTIDVGSDGQSLPQTTINVVDASGFPTTGYIYVTTDFGFQVITYSGTTSTTFDNCTGGAGTMFTGAAVTNFDPNSVPIHLTQTGINGNTLELENVSILNGGTTNPSIFMDPSTILKIKSSFIPSGFGTPPPIQGTGGNQVFISGYSQIAANTFSFDNLGYLQIEISDQSTFDYDQPSVLAATTVLPDNFVQAIADDINQNPCIFTYRPSLFNSQTNTSAQGIVNLSSDSTGGATSGANGNYSILIGGDQNVAYGDYDVVIGGFNNRVINGFSLAAPTFSWIGNGNHNTINGAHTQSTILNGVNNSISFGDNATIYAGHDNTLTTVDSSVIGGAINNINDSSWAGILSGRDNTIFGDAGQDFNVIVGGEDNHINNGTYCVIGGHSTSAGGVGNVVFGNFQGTNGTWCAVVGGIQNSSTGFSSGVFGGSNGNADADNSIVLGGDQGFTNGSFAATIAGEQNQALGQGSVAIGGQNNQATTQWSIAMGIDAQTYLPAQISFGAAGGGGGVGRAQFSIYQVSGQTIGATPVTLTDGLGTELTLQPSHAYAIKVTFIMNGVSIDKRAMFVRTLLAHCTIGGVAVIDNTDTTLSVTNGTSWTVSFSVSGTDNILHIKSTAQAGDAAWTLAVCELTEMGYGV